MYVHSETLLRNTLRPKGFLKFRARMEHRISEIDLAGSGASHMIFFSGKLHD